ncbi:hypothetical protein [Limosilactobacillus kribbianus]|uniref:hypothetical protein n=1 Tax=Limosilactobacillus kribbianus TaxID=2982695 RepID=UPI002263D00F|nr:hypothetical protein [Limosilactobacillus kribbianus]
MGKLITEMILLPTLITSMTLCQQYIVHIVLPNSMINKHRQAIIMLLIFAFQEYIILQYSYNELGNIIYPYAMAVSVIFSTDYRHWRYICGSIIITVLMFNAVLYQTHLALTHQLVYATLRLALLLLLYLLIGHYPKWQNYRFYALVLIFTNMWIDVWDRNAYIYTPLAVLGGSLIFVVITSGARYVYQRYLRYSA